MMHCGHERIKTNEWSVMAPDVGFQEAWFRLVDSSGILKHRFSWSGNDRMNIKIYVEGTGVAPPY